MRVFRPTDNPITQGYSSGHKGYDFSGLNRPDEVRAGMDGEIIERVDLYTTNWSSTPPLTTKDYGNYIKVKHTDGTFALFAHLRKGSSFIVGTKVKAGQTIARIGNTGNSSGLHLHAEYRNASNVNESVEFYTSDTPTDTITIEKTLFEKLVGNSTKYDEFVNAGYDSVQKVESAIAGHKGIATKAVENQEKAEGSLAVEKEKLKQAKQELADVIAECQREVETLKSQITELNRTNPEVAKLEKIWRVAVGELESKIIKLSDQINTLKIEKVKLEVPIKSLSFWEFIKIKFKK